MKIKSEFILNEIIGEYLVVPVGKNANRKFMLKLTETGAFLWKLLETNRTEDELVNALTEKYNIDREHARIDIRRFIESIDQIECLDW